MHLVQNTWVEEDDQELLTYLKENQLEFKFSSKEAILALTKQDLQSTVLFCDSEVMLELYEKHGIAPLSTYPKAFNQLYKRPIETLTVKECLARPMPFFVKPVRQKAFGGMLIETEIEQAYLNTFDHTQNVYFCPKVVFLNEYRLFVQDFKLVGMVNSSEYVLDTREIKQVPPPEAFLDQVLAANRASGASHCVIDVGLQKEWCVVEVNPPYALMSYGWPMEAYYSFCCSSQLCLAL